MASRGLEADTGAGSSKSIKAQSDAAFIQWDRMVVQFAGKKIPLQMDLTPLNVCLLYFQYFVDYLVTFATKVLVKDGMQII